MYLSSDYSTQEVNRMSVYDSRAARGAVVLDEKVPGWDEKINLDTLNIYSINCCILSQLFGSYYPGELGFSCYKPKEIEDCGFTYCGGSEDPDAEKMVEITAAWKRLILARRS